MERQEYSDSVFSKEDAGDSSTSKEDLYETGLTVDYDKELTGIDRLEEDKDGRMWAYFEEDVDLDLLEDVIDSLGYIPDRGQDKDGEYVIPIGRYGKSDNLNIGGFRDNDQFRIDQDGKTEAESKRASQARYEIMKKYLREKYGLDKDFMQDLDMFSKSWSEI